MKRDLITMPPGFGDEPGAIPELVQSLIERGALFVVNHSGGKDSQAMYLLLRQHVPAAQLVIVHADLGPVEWAGAFEHIKATTAGEPVHVCRSRRTLLQMIEERGMFPSPQQRQCTSDLKRGPIERTIRGITRERQAQGIPAWGLVVNYMKLRNPLGSHGPHRPLIDANLAGNVDKGVPQGRLRDELCAPLRHAPLVQHATQRLQERFVAVFASIPAHCRLQLGCEAAQRRVCVRRFLRAVAVEAHAAALLAGSGLMHVFGLKRLYRPIVPLAGKYPSREVKDVGHSSLGAEGWRGDLVRWMSCRSHSRPFSSIFAHCSAVSRMERWTSFWLSGSFGRPPGCLGFVSMSRIVHEKTNHKNFLLSMSF
jgi:hypothetical protein